MTKGPGGWAWNADTRAGLGGFLAHCLPTSTQSSYCFPLEAPWSIGGGVGMEDNHRILASLGRARLPVGDRLGF